VGYGGGPKLEHHQPKHKKNARFRYRVTYTIEGENLRYHGKEKRSNAMRINNRNHQTQLACLKREKRGAGGLTEEKKRIQMTSWRQ